MSKSKKKQKKLYEEFHSLSQFSLIGESEVLNRFIRLGLQCYIPYGDLEGCDLIVSFKGVLKKVQIKSVYSLVKGVVYADLRSKQDGYGYKYNSELVDFFAIYSYELNMAFLVPIEIVENHTAIYLRIDPPKNCQLTNINWAEDYILEKVANEVLDKICSESK